jgi:hypothetical protein
MNSHKGSPLTGRSISVKTFHITTKTNNSAEGHTTTSKPSAISNHPIAGRTDDPLASLREIPRDESERARVVVKDFGRKRFPVSVSDNFRFLVTGADQIHRPLRLILNLPVHRRNCAVSQRDTDERQQAGLISIRKILLVGDDLCNPRKMPGRPICADTGELRFVQLS